ncbi:MAG TPA: ABC transporter permease [Solirubrobacteraceae bacterium]|nr:ABC transporter permease [Solirubrobacteraceae bacterium]
MAVASGSQAPAQAPSEGPVGTRRALGATALKLGRGFLTLREGSIIVVTIATFVYFAVSTPGFATGSSFKTLLPYFAPFAIFGAGEVLVMINGEIDLSIGAVYLITPFLFDKLASAGVPLVPAVMIALLGSATVGLINGFFVAVVGISSFVATFGMLFTLDGLTLVISHAELAATKGTSSVLVTTFAQFFGEGTYSELSWALAIVVILQLVLTFTRWGVYTVAVGGNRLGAAEAGVRVKLVLIRNFIVCASCAGLVGILEAVRAVTATPDPSGSNEYLFQGIAAAVIGGTLLRGGDGTVVGALIGALFLGVLHDGLIIKGVSADYLDLYLGLAIILVMSLNVYVQRVRRGAGVA